MLVRVSVCLLALVVAAAAPAHDFSQEGAQVANFSLSAYEFRSPKFESFAFWVNTDGQKRVVYAYGSPGRSHPREVILQILGPNPDGKSFALHFANGYVLDLKPEGEQWVVNDRKGGYHKIFDWMYEGPVDGRGTFCGACIEKKDAMPFVRAHFLR